MQLSRKRTALFLGLFFPSLITLGTLLTEPTYTLGFYALTWIVGVIAFTGVAYFFLGIKEITPLKTEEKARKCEAWFGGAGVALAVISILFVLMETIFLR